MKIYINPKYAITSDPEQFIICSRGTYKSDQKVEDGKEGYKAGEEKLIPVAYVKTLKQAYNWLLYRQIRESDKCGFKALMEEVGRIERELNNSIAI